MKLNKKVVKYLIPVSTIVFLILTTGVNAVTVKEVCIDSTRQNSTYNYTLTEDGVAVNSYFEQTHECLNGCSSTLGKCRFDEYDEVIYLFIIFGGIIVYCILSMYVAKITDSMVYVILFMIAAVLCIVLALTDVFSATYRTILFLFAFIPVMFIASAYDQYKKEKEDD